MNPAIAGEICIDACTYTIILYISDIILLSCHWYFMSKLPKKRNPIAKALIDFKHKVYKDKTKYDRKKEKNRTAKPEGFPN